MRLSIRNFRASKTASAIALFALILGLGTLAGLSIYNKANADTSSLIGQRTDVDDPIVSETDGTSKLTNDRTYANTTVEKVYKGTFGTSGVLGGFHIIAFNDFDQTQQAYGNIAVKNLKGDGNNIAHFDIPTLNYIQNSNSSSAIKSFYQGNNHANSSILVVGNSVNAGGKVSPNAEDGFGELWQFNGYDMNGPRRKPGETSNEYYDNLWKEDVNGPSFLDFDTVKTDAIAQNMRLKNTADTNTIADSNTIPTGNASNLKFIRISDDDGANVMTMTYTDLIMPRTEIQVTGFDLT